MSFDHSRPSSRKRERGWEWTAKNRQGFSRFYIWDLFQSFYLAEAFTPGDTDFWDRFFFEPLKGLKKETLDGCSWSQA